MYIIHELFIIGVVEKFYIVCVVVEPRGPQLSKSRLWIISRVLQVLDYNIGRKANSVVIFMSVILHLHTVSGPKVYNFLENTKDEETYRIKNGSRYYRKNF